MKKVAISLIICLLASLVAVPAVQADSPIPPTEDTTTAIFEPDTPLNEQDLWVGYFYDGLGFENFYRSYLKFDLSSLSKNVGVDTKIQLTTYIPPASPFSISLWSVADGWSESTLTWNNSAAYPPLTLLDTQAAPTTSFTTIAFSGFKLAQYLNYERLNDPTKTASFVIQFASCSGPCSFDTVGFSDSENPFYPPLLVPSYPTAVTLSEFTARPEARHNLLEWQTTQEPDLIGFNLYRSDAPKKPINAEPIEAKQAGTTMGDSYQFEDRTALPGVTYTYWLELLEDGGNSLNASTPVRTNSEVFFPVMRR